MMYRRAAYGDFVVGCAAHICQENFMRLALPLVVVARHGETAWSLTGQHTGLTDLELTPRGEENARRLRDRLQEVPFAQVWVSPLRRALHTCELSGYEESAKRDDDLVEWNYGDYEGLTTREIRLQRPDWQLFRDGCPGGESTTDIAHRADRVIARVRTCTGNVLLFSSGHFLRVLAARWLAQEVEFARFLFLETASVSALGYEHSIDEPAIHLWNDTQHVCAPN